MTFTGMKLPSAGGCLLLFATILLLLLLIFTLFLSDNSDTATYTRLESGVDTMERKLELKRHNQLTALKASSDSTLSKFTTDGCSGGLSTGWEFLASKIEDFRTTHGTKPAWESCCITHDKLYHTGGPRKITAEKSFRARKRADLTLKSCVLQTGFKRAQELSIEYDVSIQEIEIIYTGIADLMYRSVRIGGMPCTGLPWRWGYGWPECK